MAIGSTPCSPLPATTSALGYNEDRRNYSLWMVGRQARHGRSTCVQNIYPERGWGPWQEAEDSDQRCQDRCPAIFISKIFSQKIWPKNWGGSSNWRFREWFVCGSGPAPPRPPFVQVKNTPGRSFPRGGFPGAAFGARDRSLGRSIGGWLPVSCQCLPHSCHI